MRKDAKVGTLRLVASQDGSDERVGTRLKALRLALGITHEGLVATTPEVARQLGDGYEPILRSNYSAIENGRLRFSKDSTRAVICALFKVTRDELADYLDAKIDLETILAARATRLGAPPKRAAMPRYADHPRWAELVAAARAEDPELSDATFKEVGESPFFTGPLDALDAKLLAQVARAVQNWRRRAGSKPTGL